MSERRLVVILVHANEWIFLFEQLVRSTKEMTLNDTSKKYFSPANLRATATHDGYRRLVHWYMQEQYTLRYSGKNATAGRRS